MQLLNNSNALKNLSTLVDFGNLINSSLELKFILNNLLLTCFGKYHTTRGLVALVNNNDLIKVEAIKGLPDSVINDFPKTSFNRLDESEEINTFLRDYKLKVSQKIFASNEIIGVIYLGERLLKEEYTKQDMEFLSTLSNIAASGIQNSLTINKLKNVNRELDSKVNKLSSLFDLGKEFSAAIETERIGKLLIYSIIGQLLVTRYAVVTCDINSFNVLDNRITNSNFDEILSEINLCGIDVVTNSTEIIDKFPSLSKLGIELIIPMKIKSVTKGLIFLGCKSTHQSYTKSDIEFVSSLGSLAIISLENSRLFQETLEKEILEKDLEIAKKIQKHLLPDKVPALKNFEISAVNYPARQVGGDYYDLVKLNENEILFAIADVSGKGVQAALLMANLQAFLQSIAKQNIELDKASNLINDLVSENTTDGSFITFFWGILHDSNRELVYVNMGHNPPLLIRDGTIRKLKLGGMILGVMPTMVPYVSEKIKLEKNDVLVLFTDGITEAMDVNGEEFTDERFEEFVSDITNKPATEILSGIIDEVKMFTQATPQSDDITALVVKVN
ncbi:SpoIIE family protein phosphatase [Bacteroidota bacterium]